MALRKRCLDLLSVFSSNICVNSGQIVLGNNNVTTATSHFCLLFPTRAKTLPNIVPIFLISAWKTCFFLFILTAKMNSQLEHCSLFLTLHAYSSEYHQSLHSLHLSHCLLPWNVALASSLCGARFLSSQVLLYRVKLSDMIAIHSVAWVESQTST